MTVQTKASLLVETYLALGGKRKAAADDNAVSTRLWDDEPVEAHKFWRRGIEPLPDALRKEVESLLPSISDDSP